MKILPAILVLLLIIISAGCVSFGSQTTDIMMGDEKVGSFTVTPQSDGTYAFSMTLFGTTVSKEGLTREEVDTLTEGLTKTDSAEIPDFLGSILPENAGTPSDPEEFLDNILHMPLSNSNNKTLDEAFSIPDIGEAVNQSASTLQNLISGIFGN